MPHETITSLNLNETPSLEKQIESLESIEVYGGELNVVDLSPEKKKTDVASVWLKGWGTTSKIFRDNLISLAETGRRVLAVDNPHGISVENLTEEEKSKLEPTSPIELQKITALLKLLEVKELEKVDLVTHSEGAIYGVLAAMLRPEKFRSLVLVDPAGMVGEDNQGRLIKEAVLDIALQIGRIFKKMKNIDWQALSKTLGANSDFNRVIAASPKGTHETIGEISETQIDEILILLKSLGLKIAIIHGVDDKFFSMERVQNMTKAKMVDGFYSVQGTHNQVYLHPEKFTKVIDSALDSLESLSKKDETG